MPLFGSNFETVFAQNHIVRNTRPETDGPWNYVLNVAEGISWQEVGMKFLVTIYSPLMFRQNMPEFYQARFSLHKVWHCKRHLSFQNAATGIHGRWGCKTGGGVRKVPRCDLRTGHGWDLWNRSTQLCGRNLATLSPNLTQGCLLAYYIFSGSIHASTGFTCQIPDQKTGVTFVAGFIHGARFGFCWCSKHA